MDAIERVAMAIERSKLPEAERERLLREFATGLLAELIGMCRVLRDFKRAAMGVAIVHGFVWAGMLMAIEPQLVSGPRGLFALGVFLALQGVVIAGLTEDLLGWSRDAADWNWATACRCATVEEYCRLPGAERGDWRRIAWTGGNVARLLAIAVVVAVGWPVLVPVDAAAVLWGRLSRLRRRGAPAA